MLAQNQSTQIKISLPLVLKNDLEAQASRYGMSLSSFLKLKVSNLAIHSLDRKFFASDEDESVYQQAIVEKKNLKPYNSVKDFFDDI